MRCATKGSVSAELAPRALRTAWSGQAAAPSGVRPRNEQSWGRRTAFNRRVYANGLRAVTGAAWASLMKNIQLTRYARNEMEGFTDSARRPMRPDLVPAITDGDPVNVLVMQRLT